MKPEITVDILRRYRWFPREMTFEKRAQKFHTDDASLPRFDWMRRISNQSPVWNFCARFSDVIWRGNHRWRREMSGRLGKLINVDLVSFCFAFFFFSFFAADNCDLCRLSATILPYTADLGFIKYEEWSFIFVCNLCYKTYLTVFSIKTIIYTFF